MKIFLDTNVLIDIIEHRSGEQAACTIVERYVGAYDRVCVSYLSLANIIYILRKQYTESQMRMILGTINSCMTVISGLAQHFYDIQKVAGSDLEDCLQILCAEYEQCDVILTRNVKDYIGLTRLPVMTPEEFLGYCRP